MPSLEERLKARQRHFLGMLKPSAYSDAEWWTASDPALEALEGPLPFENLFADAMQKCGSDKATGHDYQRPYGLILSQLPPGPVLEVGIGSIDPAVPRNMGSRGVPGASLRAWRSIGIFSHVYGADVDEGALFSEPGIDTFWVNQLDRDSLILLRERLLTRHPMGLSLVVDDGLHEMAAIEGTLDACFPLVRDGGFYVVEDLAPQFLAPILQRVSKLPCDAWALWSNLGQEQLQSGAVSSGREMRSEA